ncbi:hypothetical protein SAMN04487751_2446 [Microbacterium saccharophilum]|uniref:Uncharacterized protein n=1 Tax=Microbacterium saccharophilum TaxID=1213358 RepID=A0A7Z7CYP8_9MICO|nr:hypothetical protein SAMN04487751_2446 [Microbacterium saccharophilum]
MRARFCLAGDEPRTDRLAAGLLVLTGQRDVARTHALRHTRPRTDRGADAFRDPCTPETPAPPAAPDVPPVDATPDPGPSVPPAPDPSPPPVDLGEQVEDAIEELEAEVRELDRTPGAFQPQEVPFVPGDAAAPQTVQCYGDSILGGVCGSNAGTPLNSALPGWTTVDRSLGGHWSTSIAVNAGAYRMQLVDPVTIAASGDTALPTPFLFEVPADAMGGVTMRVSIAGVEGVLVHRVDLGISWRFTRAAPGDPIAVAPGTPIVSLGAMMPGASTIIWAGTNNLTATAQILADVDAMVQLHRSISDQPFWVASITPAWGNATSVYGVARTALNAQLEQRYGDHYIPVDEYIANGALTDAGIMPTSSDRSWIRSGLNPPSFHSAADWVHFNRAGQDAIARFAARFVQGGTTRAQQRALFAAEAAFQVDVHGATITVRGWAFDRSDLYDRIPVGITVDDQWMLATFADGPSPELAGFGVPGGHGFRWSKTLADGRTYKICIVGVGIGAGANAYPPCVTVALPTLLPQGDMSLIDAGGGTMAIVGWGFDHADLYASIPVGIIIDGRWHAGLTASLPSAYLRPYGVPGNHAFFQGAQVGRGTHSVCAVGVSAVTNRNSILKCDSITLK